MRTFIELPLLFGFSQESAYYGGSRRAEIVEIAPHLASIATFAVDQRGTGFFCVTHVETGMLVSSGDRRQAAIDKANQRLASITPKVMQERHQRLTRVVTRAERNH